MLASTPERGQADWLPGAIESRVLPWPRGAVQAAWCLGAGPPVERSLGHVDLVHLVQPFPPAPAHAVELVTVHDMFPFEHPEWYRRSERWTYRRSMALALRRASRLVVPSAYVAGSVQSMLGVDPERIEVVPEGVSGTFLGSLTDSETEATCARFGVTPGRFVICIGAISIRKNQLALVRAMAQLRDSDLALVMVGPQGYGAEAVSAELARGDGSNRVVRAGYLSEPDMAALVLAAAAVVHPALAEGFWACAPGGHGRRHPGDRGAQLLDPGGRRRRCRAGRRAGGSERLGDRAWRGGRQRRSQEEPGRGGQATGRTVQLAATCPADVRDLP